MSSVQRRLLQGVLLVVRRPKATLAVAGLLLVASIVLAVTRLTISTDQNQLFSSHIKFFGDYLDFNRKFPENQALYVLVQTKDAHASPPVARWTGLADGLTAKLATLADDVQSVSSRVPIDKLGRQGILFQDPAALGQTFADFKRFAPLASLWGEKPNLLTGLLARTPTGRFLAGLAAQPPDAESAGFAKLLAESWTRTITHPDEPVAVGTTVPDLATAGASTPADLGYYYLPDDADASRRVLLVRVYTKDADESLAAGKRQLEAVRDAVDSVSGAYPEFKVGLTGRPALDAEEMATTDQDTDRAEVVSCIVIFACLWFMLRSFWLALVAEIALGVGIGWTFAWATLTVGQLNLLSLVFLIALIGIGMDYLIQILTRYRREARRYTRPSAVWSRVFRYVSPPIWTACLGAAGAFFVSVLTDFRGAAELGIIAGGGLLLCLLAGYTVLPAMLVLFPAKIRGLDPSERYAPPPKARGPLRRLIGPAAWTLALAVIAPLASRATFNPNLLDMQDPRQPSVKLVKHLQTWVCVVLSKDIDVIRQARETLKGSTTVASTDSILGAFDNYGWLKQHEPEVPRINWADPTPVEERDLPKLAEQARALAKHVVATPAASTVPTTAATTSPAWASDAAAALMAFAAAVDAPPTMRPPAVTAQRLTQWQAAFVGQLRNLLGSLTPVAPDVAALPEELRGHYVAADGTYALYVIPKENLWKREPLERFVKDVESRVGKVPAHPTVTGIASDIFHTTSSIEGSFYKATAYALTLVVILVFLDLRDVKQTLLTVSVLALGLPMLVGLMGLFHIDWNFANFFGLPILIGAGHEYGVFMVHRYRETLDNPRRVWRSWDVSDRALLLCAFVTSSSFGFFAVLGHHRGLKSLGLVMALGTACIYLAATLVVRPLLKWRLERRGYYADRNADADRALEVAGNP